MDGKALGNIAALVGAMVVMFSQVNGRLDRMQAENNRRFDDMDRRFDQLLEALRIFEGRITRLEEKAGIGADTAE